MFRELIESPIDPIPAEYANTLIRLYNEPDWTLTCMGIAMLKPRIPDYKGISGAHLKYDTRSTCIKDFIERYKSLDDTPMLCYYIYSKKDGDDELKNLLTEFKEKQSITDLIKNNSDNECTVLYHEQKNCAAIFVNTTDKRIYHILMSFLSLYFPSLFKQNPMKDIDFNIAKALSKKEKAPFIKAIQAAVEPFVPEFRRLQLVALLKAMHQKKVVEALNTVNDQRNNIASILTRYKEATKLLREYVIQYEGLKVTEQYDEIEEDLIDYLSTNTALRNVKMNGNRMSFTVATRLMNYNPDAYETFKRRGAIFEGPYVHNGHGNDRLLDIFTKKENRIKFMDQIFTESPEFSVKIAGNYTIDFEGSYITTNRDFDYAYADPIYEDYIPNPHLRIFACLGGYEGKVNEALYNRNYIGAIEMCVASAGSVDLDETEQTFRPFLGWLMSSKKKVLVNRSGVEMTPEEAMLWIIDKEKDNETN